LHWPKDSVLDLPAQKESLASKFWDTDVSKRLFRMHFDTNVQL